jgi:antitoxin VapB
MISIVDSYREGAMTGKRARVFWTGRSQAVCLPKEFRVEGESVLVRREGAAIVLEPADEWPAGYVESFTGVPDDFVRQPQGGKDRRDSFE